MSTILALLLGGTEGLSDLPTPQNLYVSNASGNTVLALTWDPYPGGTGATSLFLYKDSSLVDFFGPTSTSASRNDTVSPDQSTEYHIRAYRSTDDVYSGYSAAAVWYAAAAAPSSLNFNRTGTLTYTLSWTGNSAHAVTYSIWRSLNGGSFTEFQSGLTGTSYNGTWSSLPDSAQFYITARRSDPVGPHSTASNTVDAEVTPPPDPPAAPTSLGSTRNSAMNWTLNWTNNAGSTNIIYRIYRNPNAEGFSLAATTTSLSSYTFSLGSLPSSLQAKVRAYNTSTELESSDSNTATLDVTPPPPPPTAPVLTSAIYTGGSVLLNWTNMSTPTSTDIYESDDEFGDYTHVHTNNGSGASASFARPAPDMWYQIKTINANGESDFSNAMRAQA